MCLLTNANPIVRAGAAEAAGLYVYIDPSILAQVRMLLHDPEESVRRAADHSLSAYMPPEDLK